MKPIRWVCSTLVGHIILIGGAFTIVESVVFMILESSDGTLTGGRALRLVVISLPLGIACGVACWFAITRPMLRRKGRDV